MEKKIAAAMAPFRFDSRGDPVVPGMDHAREMDQRSAHSPPVQRAQRRRIANIALHHFGAECNEIVGRLAGPHEHAHAAAAGPEGSHLLVALR